MRVSTMTQWFGGLAIVVSAAAFASAQPAMPATGHDGITVYGMGEVAGRPNLIELDLQIVGKAELTVDALVKYRDAKKRVVDALNELKVEGMTFNELGLAISAGSSAEQQQRAMQGMPPLQVRPQVEVTSTLRVTLKNIRDVAPEDVLKTVGKLLDTAQDAGVNVGPSQADLARMMRFGQMTPSTAAVRFVVADLTELREKAYEKAVADAQSRAARLAKLHQVRLGTAQLIQESQVAGDSMTIATNNQNSQQPPPIYDGEEPRLVAATLSGVPVQVRLMIRFAILPIDNKTAKQ